MRGRPWPRKSVNMPGRWVSVDQINRAGLDDTVIARYQETDKVKSLVKHIMLHDILPVLPPIKVYSRANGSHIYTIADGIHRFCAYLKLNHEFIFVEVVKA